MRFRVRRNMGEAQMDRVRVIFGIYRGMGLMPTATGISSAEITLRSHHAAECAATRRAHRLTADLAPSLRGDQGFNRLVLARAEKHAAVGKFRAGRFGLELVR